MKEINDEIELTLNTMKSDVSDGAHEELQFHLYSLLDMKRNELQKTLPVGHWIDDTSHSPPPEMIVKLYGEIDKSTKSKEN